MTTSLNLVGNSTGKSAGFVPYSSNNALNTRPQVSVFGYVGTDSRKVGHLYGKGWKHRDRTRRGPLSFHGRRPNVKRYRRQRRSGRLLCEATDDYSGLVCARRRFLRYDKGQSQM